MKKEDFIAQVATSANVTKKEAALVWDSALALIVETLAAGEKLTFVGFGSFEARPRQEREGRNPQTGKPMKIPATVVPVFSAGKDLREKVSQSRQLVAAK